MGRSETGRWTLGKVRDGFGGPSRRSGTGRETLQEVRDGTETLGEVRDRSGDPRVGPAQV